MTSTSPWLDPSSTQAAAAPRLRTKDEGLACCQDELESDRERVCVRASEEHEEVIPPMTRRDSPSWLNVAAANAWGGSASLGPAENVAPVVFSCSGQQKGRV